MRVRPGDTLESLAHEYLGNVSFFRDIADANNLDIFGELPADIIMPVVRERATAATDDDLDLSGIKMPNTAQQLISWIL